jgi:predicted enzyme related to lactoylglutathione lyase
MPNFIKHIAFKVEDVEKERAFYENVFGYKHVNTVLRKGKTLIKYESDSSDEANFAAGAPCIHHIGMEVEDLDAFIAEIKANGGEILTAPGHLPVKFRSPNGPVAEVVPMKRWEKETLAAGVHGAVLE